MNTRTLDASKKANKMTHRVATELNKLEFFPQCNQQIILKIDFNETLTHMKLKLLDFCHHFASLSALTDFVNKNILSFLNVKSTFSWPGLQARSRKHSQ